jgi:tetratricopeptide (TPR) repeat protein
MTACNDGVLDQHRSSPLSIIELSGGDLEEHPGGNDNEIHAIDIVADLSRHEERRYFDVSILPTIKEVPSMEEECGEIKSALLRDHSSNTQDDSSSLGRVTRSSASGGAQGDTTLVVARQLINQASYYASQGKEDKAIEAYNKSLHSLKKGVRAVLSRMDVAASKPKLEKIALYIALHEEWNEFAEIILEVRSALAALFEREQNFDQSIRNYEEARSIVHYQAVFDQKHHRKGSTAFQKELAMEKKIKSLEEAKESYTARLALHETIDRIREKIDATKDQTSLNFLYEDFHDQISIVLSLESVHLGDLHPQVADTKELLGILYFERGQVEKALQFIHKAIDIVENTLGFVHPRTGLKYRQAGKIYEKRGGSKSKCVAIEFYEKAVTTLKAAEWPFPEEICSLLCDLGALYIRQKNFGLAIKSLDEANKICSKSRKNGYDEANSITSIQVWLNLAECYAQSAEKDLAVTAIRKALNIQKQLHKGFDDTYKGKKRQFPHALISPQGVATTLKRLGKVLASQRKYPQAYDQLLEAMSLLQSDYNVAEAAAANDPTVDLPQYQDEIASTLYTLAGVKRADEKFTEAMKLYQESLQLRRDSDKMRPIDQRRNHVHCAMCLAGIGSIDLWRQNSSEAYKIFSAAIHVVKKEQLPDSHPIVNMLWHQSHIASRKMLEDCRIDTKAEF